VADAFRAREGRGRQIYRHVRSLPLTRRYTTSEVPWARIWHYQALVCRGGQVCGFAVAPDLAANPGTGELWRSMTAAYALRYCVPGHQPTYKTSPRNGRSRRPAAVIGHVRIKCPVGPAGIYRLDAMVITSRRPGRTIAKWSRRRRSRRPCGDRLVRGQGRGPCPFRDIVGRIGPGSPGTKGAPRRRLQR
jgi:hypothetical protein